MDPHAHWQFLEQGDDVYGYIVADGQQHSAGCFTKGLAWPTRHKLTPIPGGWLADLTPAERTVFDRLWPVLLPAYVSHALGASAACLGHTALGHPVDHARFDWLADEAAFRCEELPILACAALADDLETLCPIVVVRVTDRHVEAIPLTPITDRMGSLVPPCGGLIGIPRNAVIDDPERIDEALEQSADDEAALDADADELTDLLEELFPEQAYDADMCPLFLAACIYDVMHSDADSDVQAVCQEALALVQALGGEGITWTDAAMYLVTAGTLSELVSPIVPALNSGDHHAAAVEIGIDKILTEACQLIYDLIALQAGRALSLHRDAPEAASMETMLRSLVDADAGGPLTSDQGRLLEGVGPHLLWLSFTSCNDAIPTPRRISHRFSQTCQPLALTLTGRPASTRIAPRRTSLTVGDEQPLIAAACRRRTAHSPQPIKNTLGPIAKCQRRGCSWMCMTALWIAMAPASRVRSARA
jgi:hypothetical protein